jgi:hypothetical protein
MHVADQILAEAFEVQIGGELAGPEAVFPDWSRLDRFGIVVTEPLGGLGASLLLQLAIAQFYSVRPYRRASLAVYPEIYLFHAGGPHGDFSYFWPPRSSHRSRRQAGPIPRWLPTDTGGPTGSSVAWTRYPNRFAIMWPRPWPRVCVLANSSRRTAGSRRRRPSPISLVDSAHPRIDEVRRGGRPVRRPAGCGWPRAGVRRIPPPTWARPQHAVRPGGQRNRAKLPVPCGARPPDHRAGMRSCPALWPAPGPGRCPGPPAARGCHPPRPRRIPPQPGA